MSIIFPMGLMAIFSLLYSLIMLRSRIKAMKRGDIKPSYFRQYDNDTPPEYMQKATRQWSNLHESPVLFYAVCLAIMVLGQDDMIFTYLAWCYFGLRLVHAFIHTSYNKIFHRFIIFFSSLAVILAMWIRLLLAL